METDRLVVVVELAENAERLAAQSLGTAQARLGEAQARLASLEAYLSEYSQRPERRTDTRLRALSETQRFLVQLERSIEAQSRIVTHEDSLVQQARAHWLSTRLKLDAMRKLVDERREAAHRHREQVEQQRLDDQPGRRNPNSASG
jgi:flagellar FliJ protein